jgi:hypothetical protein
MAPGKTTKATKKATGKAPPAASGEQAGGTTSERSHAIQEKLKERIEKIKETKQLELEIKEVGERLKKKSTKQLSEAYERNVRDGVPDAKALHDRALTEEMICIDEGTASALKEGREEMNAYNSNDERKRKPGSTGGGNAAKKQKKEAGVKDVTTPLVETVLGAGLLGSNATDIDGDDDISAYFPFGGVMHVVYGPWDKYICASCGVVMRARTVAEHWEKNHDDKYNLAGTKEISEWATTTSEAIVAASQAPTKKEGEDILYDAGILKRRESASGTSPKPTGHAVKTKKEVKSPSRASDRIKSKRDADKGPMMTYAKLRDAPPAVVTCWLATPLEDGGAGWGSVAVRLTQKKKMTPTELRALVEEEFTEHYAGHITS